MFKTVLSSVIALSVANASQADTWVIAIPHTLPGSADTLTDPLWSFFLHGLSAGDRYTLLNATEAGQIARFVVPKDKKYDRAKWRSKHFARENARLAAHLATIGQGDPVIDPPGLLRHDALNRIDRTSPRDILVIGSAVYLSKMEPGVDMKRDDAYRDPSPEHLNVDVGQSVFGMGTEGKNGLAGSFIHFCAIGDALETDAEAAYQRFYGNYIAARGGVLVTWSDDLLTCFERFTAQVRTPLDIAPYEDASGVLRMIDRSRTPVPAETSAVFVEDVEIERFNLFASKPHPTLPGVEVTTGIEYDPAKYPDIYEQAYCYFNTSKDGVRVRLDLGNKNFGRPVISLSSTHSALRAAGITEQQFEAGKPACQWPTSCMQDITYQRYFRVPLFCFYRVG